MEPFAWPLRIRSSRAFPYSLKAKCWQPAICSSASSSSRTASGPSSTLRASVWRTSHPSCRYFPSRYQRYPSRRLHVQVSRAYRGPLCQHWILCFPTRRKWSLSNHWLTRLSVSDDRMECAHSWQKLDFRSGLEGRWAWPLNTQYF